MSLHSTTTVRRLAGLAVVPLLLVLAGCGADVPSTSDQISDDPTIDEGDIGGHDEVGGAAGMCAYGATECVDTVVDDGDRIMEPDIHQVDALPADVRAVETAPGAGTEAFPVFLQEAVVDGAAVTVLFSGSEAPCFFVDHAAVDEQADQVVVTVMTATGDTDGVDCSTSPTSLQFVTVQLDAPLGDRLLLDGSRVPVAG